MELHELVERIERWKNRQAGNEESDPISAPAQDSSMAEESLASEPEAFQEEETKDFDINEYAEQYAAQYAERYAEVENAEPEPEPEPEPGETNDPEDPIDFISEDDENGVNRISLSDFEEVK